MSVSVSLRLSDEIGKRIEELASLLNRPKSFIMKKAIEEYLDEYADYLIAIERLNDKDDRIISSRELRDELGL